MAPRSLHRCAFLALLAVGACSGPAALDTADAGRTRSYEPGLPNFDMETIATVRDGTPGLDLYLSLPQVSLVFVQDEDGFTARYEVLVRLLDRRGRDLLSEETFTDTVRVSTYAATQAFATLQRRERLEAAPGRYVVEVVVADQNSEATAMRRQATEVPTPGEGAFLSRIRLEGRPPGGGFTPIVSRYAPAGLDSLRAVVELFDTEADHTTAQLRLFRLPSDTTVARAPYWISPAFGSLPYIGVRYGAPDTLQVSRRPLPRIDEAVEVAFSLPPLPEGVYRIEVEVTAEEGGARIEQVRDFSVAPSTFPRVADLDQMIEALVYIAYESEVGFIQEGKTATERKRRFDAFWGSLVANRALAANLIKLYYSRIEEANLLFTTFKAGWKTDRGMLYTIMGAPLYVEQRFDSEVWHYSYASEDPLQTFVFERVTMLEAEGTFENYVLQRRPFYERSWLRALDRWREGVVL